MSSVLHEVDPDGDLILVLKEPGTQRIVPDVYVYQFPHQEAESPEFMLDGGCPSGPCFPQHFPLWREDNESQAEIRFRVSSRHLMLASSTFKKMLSGPWKESQPAGPQHLSLQEMHEASYTDSSSNSASPGDQGPSSPQLSHSPCIREVSTTGWNAYALLAVLKIIHSQCYGVDRCVGVRYIAEVAVIANYYQCTQALSFATQVWLDGNYTLQRLEFRYGKEIIMWLFIAWTFSRGSLFEPVACTIVMYGRGLSYVETYDLPISEILAALEIKRLNALQSLISALSDLKGKAKRNELGCRYHRCRALIIGSLELNLEEHPELTVEDGNYDGMSISEVIDTVQNQFEPNESETRCGTHLCTPKLLMQSTIRSVQEEISSITLSDFQH
ncbi:hypothetical protein NW768_002899 [Fusarium equiseti]|uniref:BTB domain-containing protein n=1 Tax=Fusarium equiseti TaxID=61235 RepID=A0ABQ8RL60_FUSEQ|nr:hypothetical protein NW768_002899 [Fusarium equiseti]